MRTVHGLFAGTAALFLGIGCGAADTASPPQAAPPAADKPSPPWVEILDHLGRARLVGRGPDGGVRYSVDVVNPREVVLVPGGGACLVADERKDRAPTVMCVDKEGEVLWRDARSPGATVRLFLSGKELLIFDLGPDLDSSGRRSDSRTARLIRREVSTGEGKGGVFPSQGSDVARLGEDFVLAEGNQVARRTLDGKLVWWVQARLFPSADPTARTPDRKVAVNAAGVTLTGASDGSLLALDAEGRPLYQLGVHGAVSRIEARSDGDFVVRAGGMATVVGPRGVVRREVPSRSEPQERPGVQDRRAPGEPPPLRVTLAYRIEPQSLNGKPLGGVQSVVALAPHDVWALHGEWERKLVHFDGRAWTDRGAASVKYPREVFVDGKPAEESTFGAFQLARGPKGTLLIVGSRAGSSARRLSVLEYTGGAFHERADLAPLLAKMPVDYNAVPAYTVSPTGHEVLCGNKGVGCVEVPPGQAPRSLPLDRGQGMPGVAGDPTWGPVPRMVAGETLWKTTGAALPDGDVISAGQDALFRGRGGLIEPFPSPLQAPRTVWASSKSDVWVTERDTLSRFDGARWWRLPRIGGGEVTGSGPDDVWVARGRLWHLTPDPRARADIEAVTAPPPPAAGPSEPLRIAGVDPVYKLERASLDVDKGPPLRTAFNIVSGSGGVSWLHEGSRVVEYDGAAARVIYQSKKPEPFHCWSAPEAECNLCADCNERLPAVLTCSQCAAPAKPGEGAMIVDGVWQWARAGVTTEQPLDAGPLTAIATAPSGIAWGVSVDQEMQAGVLVLDAQGWRVLTGLPPALYTSMVLRAEDDAWLAGGLGTSREGSVPAAEGEGTLVHYDGHTFTRSRGPEGPLLAVTAVGSAEAWAVGLDGGVLHQKGAVSRAFHVEGEDGKRMRVALRAVAASSPTDVLFAGEGATLLHWDGTALHRVDTSSVDRMAAFSGLIPPSGTRPGWVSGPGGLWKIVRSP